MGWDSPVWKLRLPPWPAVIAEVLTEGGRSRDTRQILTTCGHCSGHQRESKEQTKHPLVPELAEETQHRKQVNTQPRMTINRMMTSHDTQDPESPEGLQQRVRGQSA